MSTHLVGLYISISMRHGRRRGLGEGIFSDVEFLKEVMADGLTLHHSVFLSLSLSLFVKPERCRQRLPAAPSVAVKCPKFISGERQGRQVVRKKKIYHESDTRGLTERRVGGQEQTRQPKLTLEAFFSNETSLSKGCRIVVTRQKERRGKNGLRV